MNSYHAEIKSMLVKVYEKLSKAITKDIGYEQYKIIIQTYITSEKDINYILQQVSDYIGGLSLKEKETGLRLLPLIFCTTTDSYDCYRVISPILSIIQFNITESNLSITPVIANCFGKIVQCSMQNDIELIDIDEYEEKIYEILQGFCIYNMKQPEKANKICGSSCLTRLVENCPFVLQPQYMKFIWENIMHFIDKRHFIAKYELLNSLISLILGAEEEFGLYANATLYKVADFLTDGDWIKRKLALNVVYTLILYCKEETLPLKEDIVEFLKALKGDKVKEVREVCLLILHKLSEKDEGEMTVKAERKIQAKARPKHALHYKSVSSLRKKGGELKTEETKNLKVNTSLNDNTSSSKTKRDLSLFKGLSTSNSNLNINRSGDKKPLTPTRQSQMKNLPQLNLNKTQDEEAERKSKKVVNKKDNLFMNEKMVIRRNPNYSIYKSGPNRDFFNQANNQPDIIVLENKRHHRVLSGEGQGEGEEEKKLIALQPNEGLFNSKEGSDQKHKDDNENNESDSIETNHHNALKPKYRNQGKTINSTQNIYEKDAEQISFKNSIMVDSKAPTLNTFQTNAKRTNVNNEQDEEKRKEGDDNENECETIRNTFPSSNHNMPLKRTELPETNCSPHIANVIDTSIAKTKTSSTIEKDNKCDSSPKPSKSSINSLFSVVALQQFKIKAKPNDLRPNPQLLTDLLQQMNSLSHKQVFLINALTDMQESTLSQIDLIKAKMLQLESTMTSLSNQIVSLKSRKQQTNSQCLTNSTLSPPNNSKIDNWEGVLSSLNSFNIDQAFTKALANDNDLIRMISQITINQLREASPSLLNDSILRLSSLLTKGNHITSILAYLKNILLRVKCELMNVTKNNLKDILAYISDNSMHFSQINDENIVDINLILSYLKTMR